LLTNSPPELPQDAFRLDSETILTLIILANAGAGTLAKAARKTTVSTIERMANLS
jgi:hypothetical protein